MSINNRLNIKTVANLVVVIFLLIAGGRCCHKISYYDPEMDITQPFNISEDQLVWPFLFIGDAGEPTETEPGLVTLQKWASYHPELTTVIFLGDNIYPSGLPTASYPLSLFPAPLILIVC